MMNSNTSAETARHVLWTFGDRELGRQPGGFMEALYVAIRRADSFNRQRLRRGFPDEVAAYVLAAEHPEGMDVLRARVRN